jgi:hypothetical protein
MTPGLTLEQLLLTVQHDIPTDALGDLLRRLPAKYNDRELQLFRPITPAILLALDLMDECEGSCDCDARLADMIEVVAADPAPDPTMPAWANMPDGTPLYISKLLATVAERLAGLYAATPKTRSTPKKPAPVA